MDGDELKGNVTDQKFGEIAQEADREDQVIYVDYQPDIDYETEEVASEDQLTALKFQGSQNLTVNNKYISEQEFLDAEGKRIENLPEKKTQHIFSSQNNIKNMNKTYWQIIRKCTQF